MSLDTAAPPTPIEAPAVAGSSSAAANTSNGSVSAKTAAPAAAGSSANPTSPSASSGPQQINLRAIVSSKDAGIIIGKAGKNVADLREQTGVRAGVSKVVPGVQDRVLTVSGSLEGVTKAFGTILQNLSENQAANGEGNDASTINVKLLVANSLMGSIIGKGGATIQALQQEHSTKIITSKETLPGSTERMVSIEGSSSAVQSTIGELARIISEQDAARVQSNTLYQPGGHGQLTQGGPSSPQAMFGGGVPIIAGPGGYGRAPFGNTGGNRGGFSDRQPNSVPRRQGGPSNGQPRGPNTGNFTSAQGGASAAHASQAVPTPSNPELRTQNISIPSDMVGCIIGRAGVKINQIRHDSGAKISIAKDAHDESGERMFTITGSSDALEKALFLLYSQLEGEKEKRISNQKNEQAGAEFGGS